MIEEYIKVCQCIFIVSSFCGFLCSIALLILLFRIPSASATDCHDELDFNGKSLQAGQILDSNWTVTRLLILAALHAIIIPWGLILIKPLGQMIYISYPVFEIIWFSLFRKILYAKKFRVTPFFRPAEIICIIDLIPIALVFILFIPGIPFFFLFSRF